MKRKIIHISILLILFIFCNCNVVKINENNPTLIVDKPLLIDNSHFDIIKDSLKVIKVRQAPDYLGGLTPKYDIAMGIYRINDIFKDSGLYCYGNTIISQVGLIIERNNNYELITSKLRLKELFAPIETKEEALSYACLLCSGEPLYEINAHGRRIKKYVKTINKTFVEETDNSYKVLLYDYDIFYSCAEKIMYSYEVLINKNGELISIRKQKIFSYFGGGCYD